MNHERQLLYRLIIKYRKWILDITFGWVNDWIHSSILTLIKLINFSLTKQFIEDQRELLIHNIKY